MKTAIKNTLKTVVALLFLATALQASGDDWFPLAGTTDSEGVNGEVRAMAYSEDGRLFVGSNPSAVEGRLYEWDGSQWSLIDTLDGVIYDLAFSPSDGRLYVGGAFGDVGGGIAAYDLETEEWSSLGLGIETGQVRAIAFDPAGTLYIGGTFTALEDGTVYASNLARWDGSEWSSLDGFLESGVDGTVYSVLVQPGGNMIFFGGDFAQYSNGDPASYIGIWDGNNWLSVDEDIDGPIYDLVLSSDGMSLYAAGEGGVYRMSFDSPPGEQWSQIGSFEGARALLMSDDGELYAGGSFEERILRYGAGGAWYDLGDGSGDAIYALASAGGETLFAGGSFTDWGSHVAAITPRLIHGPPTVAVGSEASFFLADDLDESSGAWSVDDQQEQAGGDTFSHTFSEPGIYAIGWEGESALGEPISRTHLIRVYGGEVQAQVAGGYGFSLHLREDGTLWAMGDNSDGQLGIGTEGWYESTPVRVRSADGTGYLENIVAIAAGGSGQMADGDPFALALTEAGTVYAWGSNSNDRLGSGAVGDLTATLPVKVEDLEDIIAIAAGANYAVALNKDGHVLSWGHNGFTRQLGDGGVTATDSGDPVTAMKKSDAPLSDIVQISSGGQHTVALRADGSVWSWGSSSALGVPGDDGGHRFYARRALGGDTDRGFFEEAVAIGGVSGSSFALRRDGTLWGWGRNFSGTLGDEEACLDQGINDSFSCFLPVQVHGGESGDAYLQGVEAIDTGIGYAFARTAGGEIWTIGSHGSNALFGENKTAPARVPGGQSGEAQLSDIVQVSGSAAHYLALDSSDRLWGWSGYNGNDDGQLGLGDTDDRGEPTLLYPRWVALDADQAVVMPGESVGFEVELSEALPGESVQWSVSDGHSESGGESFAHTFSEPGLYHVTATAEQLGGVSDTVLVRVMDDQGGLAAGDESSFVIDSAGQAWGFGAGLTGVLGVGDDDVRTTPDAVLVDKRVAQIRSGQWHTLILREDGSLWGTGDNDDSQVKDSTEWNYVTPVEILSEGVVAVDAAVNHSMILDRYGVVSVFGGNYDGHLGPYGDPISAPTPLEANGLGPVVAIATGNRHHLLLDAYGDVWSFGEGENGKLGNDSPNDRDYPERITGYASIDAVAIAAGANHSLVLDSSGDVWSFGQNDEGQLGLGHTDDGYLPQKIDLPEPIVAIEAGGAFSLALDASGNLWGFGDHKDLQLGLGYGNLIETSPVKIDHLQGVTHIAAGADHSLARTADGGVWSFGASSAGELGSAQTGDWREYPERVLLSPTHGYLNTLGYESLESPLSLSKTYVEDTNLTVIVKDSSGDPIAYQEIVIASGATTADLNLSIPAGAEDITVHYELNSGDSMLAEQAHLSANGLWSLEVGDSFADIGQLQALGALGALPEVLNIALLRDGGSSVPVGSEVSFTAQIEALHEPLDITWQMNDDRAEPLSEHFSYTFDEPGLYSTTLSVTDSENNTKTATQIVRVVGDAEQIAAGAGHTLRRNADGTVSIWGSNDQDQLGIDQVMVPIALTPLTHPGLSDVVAVKAGSNFSVALKSDGTVWSWGDNSNGRLGIGESDGSYDTPMPVVGGAMGGDYLEGIVAIAAGEAHALALHESGTLYAWGWNNSMGLGDGTTTSRSSPIATHIGSIAGTIVAIDAGHSRSLALTDGGEVYAWGRRSHDGSSHGDTGTPYPVSGLSDITAIASGWRFNMALTGDGDLYTWGLNSSGQLGDGTTTDKDMVASPVLTDVSAIAAGHSHALAVSGGQLYAWGDGDQGQLGTGETDSESTPQIVDLGGSVDRAYAGRHHNYAITTEGVWYAWGSNSEKQLGGPFSTDGVGYLPTPATLQVGQWLPEKSVDGGMKMRRYLRAATDGYGRTFALYSGDIEDYDPLEGANELRVAVKSGGSWQHHQLLSDAYADGYDRMAIATNDKGQAAIAYVSGDIDRIHLYRTLDGGQSWQPLEPLIDQSFVSDLDLALDADGQPHLVFQRSEDSENQATYATYQGGWQIEVVGTEDNSGNQVGRSGQIAISQGGVIHYVYGGFGGNYLIHARREGADSWQVSSLPDASYENAVSGRFELLLEDETIHLFYKNPNYGIVQTRSSDGGQSWTLETAAGDLDLTGFVSAAIDGDGHAHILAQKSVYMGMSFDRYIVYLSNDSGSWQAGWRVVNDTIAECIEDLAACTIGREGVYLDDYTLSYSAGYDRLEMIFIDRRIARMGLTYSYTPSGATPPSPPEPAYTLTRPEGISLDEPVVVRIWARDRLSDETVADTLVTLQPGQQSVPFELSAHEGGDLVYGYRVEQGVDEGLVIEGYLGADGTTLAYHDQVEGFSAPPESFSLQLMGGTRLQGVLEMTLPAGERVSIFARPADLGQSSLFRHRVQTQLTADGGSVLPFDLVLPQEDGFDRYIIGYELDTPSGTVVAQGYYSSEETTPYYAQADILQTESLPGSITLSAIEGVSISGLISNATDLDKAIVIAQREDGYFTFVDAPTQGAYTIAVPATQAPKSYRVGLYLLDAQPELALEKIPAWHGGGAHRHQASTFTIAQSGVSGRDITVSSVEASTIELRSGWNLLSLPHKAEFGSFELALNFGVHPAIEQLLSYDQHGWRHYAAKPEGFKPHLDRMTALSSQEGFWLRSRQTETLRLHLAADSGAVDALPELSPGWNLVGLHRAIDPADLAQEVAASGLEPITLWVYRAGEWQVYIHSAALDTTELVDTPRIDTIAPSEGVWIHTKEQP